MTAPRNTSKTTSKKETRSNLKKLTKTTKHHKARSGARIVKYGAKSFARNIWLSLASTLVMTFTLLILFATTLASVVLSETAASMKNKIDITIFFQPTTPESTLKDLATIIKTNDNVRSDSIVSNTSERELELFIQENSSNQELMDTINDEDMRNIMIQNMQSTIRFKVYDADNLDSIKTLIKTNEDIQNHLDLEKSPTYDVNQAEIATITSWATIAKNGGMILGVIFLIISILVIFNTVRMAIFSRREEIYMMKLIGADRNFIRGPFIIEAQMSGLISGIIAAAIGYFGFRLVAPTLESYGINISPISQVLNSSLVIAFFAAMILLGVIIGSVSARLAAKKYLKKL